MALRDVLFGRSPDKTRTQDTPARAPRATTAKTSGSAKNAKSAGGAKTTGAARTARTKAASGASAGRGKAAAKSAAGSTSRTGAKSAAGSPRRTSAGRGAKPAAKRAAKPAAKSGAKPLPKAIARRSPPAAGRFAAWWRSTSASAGKPRPAPAATAARAADGAAEATPLLQRRSVTALVARAAVLALAFVAMVAFAVALARVTLVPSPASDALVHTNLRPGASIRAYLDQPNLRDIVKQIGGNVLLGVPFGILLPALFPRARGLLRVALFTALVMLLVETAQGLIVEGRAFDIDDVILNTTGALIGYLLIGRRLGRALHPRRVHWWHRPGYGAGPESDR